MFDEDPSNDILVDLDAKRLRYDQCDPRTAKARVAALEFNDGANECDGRTFRPRFRSLLRRENYEFEADALKTSMFSVQETAPASIAVRVLREKPE